jgi:hypothetical protein
MNIWTVPCWGRLANRSWGKEGLRNVLSILNGLRYSQKKFEAVMSKKRALVFDGYTVIKLLRELDVSFEEIASLGCHIEGESHTKLRPELVAVWFAEERMEREPEHGIPE